jgi:hypothetical protein
MFSLISRSNKSRSKSVSKSPSKKTIDLECDKKIGDTDLEVLKNKKKVFNIFNNIKDDKCCDKGSCDKLQNIFEYLEYECNDAFKIDPHTEKSGPCSRIKDKKNNAMERYNIFSKKYGGKKSKTKKNKTKKSKK